MSIIDRSTHRAWLLAHFEDLLDFGRRTPVEGGGAAWLDDDGAPIAEEGAQTRHLGLRGALDVDVLLVPHHGSGRHSPAFVAASRPDVALVSVGEGNDYGHPAARTLASVNATGAVTFRTDERGSITVARAPDGGLAVTTQR